MSLVNADPAGITLTPETVAENDPGAVLAIVSVADQDNNYTAGDLDIAGDTGNLFELADQGGSIVLKLQEGKSLDFETTQPEVTVTLGDLSSAPFSPAPTDDLSDNPNTPPTADDGTATTDEDVEDFVIDIAALIDDAEDGEPTITEATSADGTVTIDGTQLLFTPTPDFNGEAVISYTVTDLGTATATGTVTVTVNPVNDAPTVAGTLTGVTVTDAEGTTIDLSGLTVADIDNDAGEVTLGVRLAGGDPAPAGVAVSGTTLTIPSGLAVGDLDLEVFANDGELDSEFVVSLTVTVEEEVTVDPFEAIFIQGEDFGIIEPQPGSVSLDRTRDGNQEQPGENSDGSQNTPTGNNNTGLPNFDKFGLRPGYSGDGYLDINGDDTGAQIETTFDAPAGTYDIVVRLGNGSTARPISIIVDGVSQTIADTSTGEWFLWEERTVTVTLDSGGSHTLQIAQNDGSGAPNIDVVAIAETGTPVDFDAPEIATSGLSVAENTTDTDALSAVDFDGSTVTYEITGGADQDLFTIDPATGALSFIGAPDFETPGSDDSSNVYEVQVSAEDETGDASVRTLSVTVTDVNEAPVVTGTLIDVAVTPVEGTTIDLSGLAVTDVDNDPGDVTLGVRLAGGGAAPDGVTVSGTTLTIPAGLELGDLALEIFANDGELNSDFAVPLTVTVEEEVTADPFETIILQAEDGTPGANSAGTVVRDEGNPETGTGFSGLRPDFGGTGYIDYGSAAGDAYTYSFNDDAGGARVLHVRYATNGDRPLDVLVNGTSVLGGTAPFTDTDPDGNGGAEGFDTWEVAAFDITTVAGNNTVTLEIPAPGANAPNVDAIAISDTGATVDFPIVDISADADGDLAATPLAYTVGLPEAESVEFTLSGIDEDVTGLEVSTDGGTNFAAATLGPVTDGVAQVTVDLGAITDAGSSEVVFRVTDGDANTATTGVSIDFVGETVVAEIQAETFIVTDANGDTAPASNQPGFTGSGFMDMGLDVGDAVSFDVTVAEAGTYSLLFRYASSTDRPMTLAVDGSVIGDPLPFASTGDFETWEGQSIEVALGAGPNTITLANVDATGPNIDRVAILSDVPVIDTPPTADDGNAPGLEDDASIVVDIADLIADIEDAPAEPTITAAEVDPASGTVTFAGTELTFIPTLNFNGQAVITYTVEDSAGQPATATVTVDVAAVNDAPVLAEATGDATVPATGGAVLLADLGVTASDVDGDPTTLSIVGDLPTGVTFDGTSLLVTSEAVPGTDTITVVADDGDLNSESVSFDLTVEPPVDQPATAITLTPVDAAENATGAVVATVAVTDPDTGYAAANLALAGPDADLFELVDDGLGGVQLKLVDGQALDFEADAQPSVTVTLGLLSSDPFTPTVTDMPEAIDVTFDGLITSYANRQDRPQDGGAGVSVNEDGTTLTLDGNLWKRVPLDAGYPITENSRLKVTIEIGTLVPEIVAIGFDDDENAFENDQTVYQIGGTQGQGNFVDLRGQGVDNGDGTLTFTIDLSEQAGTSPDSMVFIADDDAGAVGSATFSAVSLFEATDEIGGNTPPRVVGGGVADLSVPEGASIEVDLPFVDDDGDALTYGYEITDADGNVVSDGLSLSGSVLSGPAPDVPGVYTVTLTADDDGDGPNAAVASTFELTVINVNDAPVSEDPALEPYFFRAGEPIPGVDLASFEAFFSDADGDPLVITAEDLPAGLTVNDEGAIEGTPTVGGDFTVTIRATDPSGLSATLTIDLLIEGGQIGDEMVIEAEDFTGLADATGFFANAQPGASQNEILRVASAGIDASITTDLSQNGLAEGYYNVSMTRYDETDGSATYSLTIGDTVLADNEPFDAGGTPSTTPARAAMPASRATSRR